MIRSLDIDGFRCFRRLKVQPLARLNLFIGLNNSGKSSLLEAVNCLVRLGELQSIAKPMIRRQEVLAGNATVLDVRRLFTGHSLQVGASFEIRSIETGGSGRVTVRVDDSPLVATSNDANDALLEIGPGIQVLEIAGQRAKRAEVSSRYQLTAEGGAPGNRRHAKTLDSIETVEFVTPDSSLSAQIAAGWSHVALTPYESVVDGALQVLAPSLERIAYVQESTALGGTFRVKLAEHDFPVPLGSLGDGVWRALSLVTSLVRARNGFLLADEIDTGLHHSVMADIWRIVAEAAQSLNVQVFATTHSLDCIRGLAQICREDRTGSDALVSMHRLEPGRESSVPYTEGQIIVAAEQGIETR